MKLIKINELSTDQWIDFLNKKYVVEQNFNLSFTFLTILDPALDSVITMQELDAVFRAVKNKKAPGSEYKNNLKVKKAQYYSHIKSFLENFRNGEEFLRAVREFKGKLIKINELSTDQWIDFLNKKYVVVQNFNLSFTFLTILDPVLDSVITM